MRCVFCHNPDIVMGKGEKDESELIDFLKTRVGKLTAVVFSGGEPTLYPELESLISRVREMGFKIKLDTNGSRPEILQNLLDKNILNYVAMDYKCVPEKTEALIGTKKYVEAFRTSLALMIEAAKKDVTFEVRTTFHTDLMSEDDLNWIIDDLEKMGYQGTYYIQNIASTGDKTIGHIAAPTRAFDKARIKEPKSFKWAYRNFPEELK